MGGQLGAPRFIVQPVIHREVPVCHIWTRFDNVWQWKESPAKTGLRHAYWLPRKGEFFFDAGIFWRTSTIQGDFSFAVTFRWLIFWELLCLVGLFCSYLLPNSKVGTFRIWVKKHLNLTLHTVPVHISKNMLMWHFLNFFILGSKLVFSRRHLIIRFLNPYKKGTRKHKIR